MISEALTLARNFGPWFGGVAAVALLAGLGAGFYGGLRWQAGEVADAELAATKAEAKLAEFRAELATATATQEANAAARQLEAVEHELARDRRITAALDRLPTDVAALMAPQFAELRRSVDAPEFDCLRLSLPEPFLRGVRRPGADPAPSGDRRDPEGAGGSAGVP